MGYSFIVLGFVWAGGKRIEVVKLDWGKLRANERRGSSLIHHDDRSLDFLI